MICFMEWGWGDYYGMQLAVGGGGALAVLRALALGSRIPAGLPFELIMLIIAGEARKHACRGTCVCAAIS